MIPLDKNHAILGAATNAAFAFQHAAKIIQIRILSDKTDNAGHEFVTTHAIQVDPQILLLRGQCGRFAIAEALSSDIGVGAVDHASDGALLHGGKVLIPHAETRRRGGQTGRLCISQRLRAYAGTRDVSTT